MLKYFVYTVIIACAVTLIVNYSRNRSSYVAKLLRYFSNKNGVLLTADELKRFNGVDRKELYISLLGNVFDVTNGTQHYGPGQSYNVFVGQFVLKLFYTPILVRERTNFKDEVLLTYGICL